MATVDGKKTGGRKRGALNKRTRDLIQILEQAGYCPVAEIIEIGALAKKEYQRSALIYDAIEDKRIEANIKTPLSDTAPTYLKLMQDSALGIMPFMYPKRKAVELTGSEGKDFFQSFTSLIKEIAKDKSHDPK